MGTAFERLSIAAAPDLRAVPGDLCARVNGSVLELPEQAVDAYAKRGVYKADQLLSHLWAYPADAASAMGWAVDVVEPARRRLAAALEGLVPESLLRPAPRRVPELGA